MNTAALTFQQLEIEFRNLAAREWALSVNLDRPGPRDQARRALLGWIAIEQQNPPAAPEHLRGVRANLVDAFEYLNTWLLFEQRTGFNAKWYVVGDGDQNLRNDFQRYASYAAKKAGAVAQTASPGDAEQAWLHILHHRHESGLVDRIEQPCSASARVLHQLAEDEQLGICSPLTVKAKDPAPRINHEFHCEWCRLHWCDASDLMLCPNCATERIASMARAASYPVFHGATNKIERPSFTLMPCEGRNQSASEVLTIPEALVGHPGHLDAAELLRLMAYSNERASGPTLSLRRAEQQLTRWEQIAISHLSDDTVEVVVDGVSQNCGFAALGFADRRGPGAPIRAWKILLHLLKHQILKKAPTANKRQWNRQRKYIEQFRKTLKANFSIAADPLVEEGGLYRAAFRTGADEKRAGCEDFTPPDPAISKT